MRGTHSLTLATPALLIALACWPAEASQASTGSNSVQAVAVNSPNGAALARAFKPRTSTYEAGYRAGFRRGIRDGHKDCSRRRSHGQLRTLSPYTRGYTAGYIKGYFSVCKR
jgi:hypothetical protein